MQINTLPSINAQEESDNRIPNAANIMLNDASTLASISTWATANTASTASSHTQSKDRSSGQNPQKKSAENSTMKTIVLKETNADFLTISETSHAFLTRWENVNFQTRNAGFHTRRKYK